MLLLSGNETRRGESGVTLGLCGEWDASDVSPSQTGGCAFCFWGDVQTVVVVPGRTYLVRFTSLVARKRQSSSHTAFRSKNWQWPINRRRCKRKKTQPEHTVSPSSKKSRWGLPSYPSRRPLQSPPSFIPFHLATHRHTSRVSLDLSRRVSVKDPFHLPTMALTVPTHIPDLPPSPTRDGSRYQARHSWAHRLYRDTDPIGLSFQELRTPTPSLPPRPIDQNRSRLQQAGLPGFPKKGTNQ